MSIQDRISFGLVVLLAFCLVGGGVYWWKIRTNCCEPPIEVIEARDAATALKDDWEGTWSYYATTGDGYSQGVNLRLYVDDGTVFGEFDAVWSFVSAPAARLNTGSVTVIAVKPNEIVAEWEGGRDDRGQVVLRLSQDKHQLTWEGTLSAGVTDDGYALNGQRTFYRNQWATWNIVQQTEFLQTVKNLLQEKNSAYTIQPGEDATIMVTGNYAVINAFVPNAPDEESGWVYFKKDAEKWGIVLGPKVRFSKTELDQAGIPPVMRY